MCGWRGRTEWVTRGETEPEREREQYYSSSSEEELGLYHICTRRLTSMGLSGNNNRDRAAVNNVAIRTLSIVYPNLFDIGCFSHTLCWRKDDNTNTGPVCQIMDQHVFSESKIQTSLEDTNWIVCARIFKYTLVVQVGND